MENPIDRLTTGVSDAELERRWQAAREVMLRHKLDYLLMRNDEEFLGGYIRWFSDMPARHSYPMTVIFDADEGLTTITCSPSPPADPFPPAFALRGVKKRLGAPYFASVHYTAHMDAELAAGELKAKKGAVVGLVGRTSIPITFYEHLVKELPGHAFVDVTDDIDRVMVPKSLEEQALIRQTAALQDKAMDHLKKVIKPGMRDFEVLAEAQYSVVRDGSERQLILVSSAPPVNNAKYQFRRFQNRVIKEGDRVAVLIETNGPGGFYTEIGRMFCLGGPPQELVDAFSLAVEAQRVSLDRLKPGVSPAEIAAANDEFLTARGFFPERRLYAHGQGYNLVERPLIRRDEPMLIEEGMNITVHPFVVSDNIWASVCDNYLVTASGPGPCLHRTPKELIVL